MSQSPESSINLDALYHPPRPAGFDHEAPVWSEILPGLFQGGTHDVDVLGNQIAGSTAQIGPADFDTVVTMYQHANPADWFVREIRFPIYDHILDRSYREDLFDVVKLAHADWKKGKRVLIRCQAGLNRSGLIMALVLIREGYTATQAIEMQRTARSNWVLFNEDFIDFLLELDPAEWRGESYGCASPHAAA